MLRFLKDKNFRQLFLLVIFLVTLYIWLSVKFDTFVIPRLTILDTLFRASQQLRPPPKEISEIVIVAVDDHTYEKMGKRWPWPRSLHAELINKINRYSPKVIAFDFTLVGRSTNPADDLALLGALKKGGNVIFSSYFSPRGEYIAPDKIFQDGLLAYGLVNKPRDKDLYVRNARTLVISPQERRVNYSFEVKTVCAFKNIPLKLIFYRGEDILLKGSAVGGEDIHIPIRPDGTMPINYFSPLSDFQVISYWDAFKKDYPAQTFKDKIVLVGSVAEIFHDVYHTPFRIMAGVTINANEILTILSGRYIKELAPSYDYLILILVAVLTAILTYFLTPIKGLLVAILEILIFAYVSFNLFLKDYRIDFFSPLFMIALVYLGTSGYKYVTLLIESVTLKTLAITDGLTGLFLPRYFQVRLQNEFERTVRYGPVLSLVMMDIDHFKQINDTYGHQQGNVVLKAMAEILRNGSRKVDILARYGGEEFCALLPHTTQAGALEYSERLRKAIEAYAFPSPKGPLKITLSFGVVGIPREGISSPEEFVACADAALYRAKAEGRNRVYPFDPALDKK